MPDIHGRLPDGTSGTLHEDGSFTPDPPEVDSVSGGSPSAVMAPPPAPAPATRPAIVPAPVRPRGNGGILDMTNNVEPFTINSEDSGFTKALKHVGNFARDSVKAGVQDVDAFGRGLGMGLEIPAAAGIQSLVTGEPYDQLRARMKAWDDSRKQELKDSGNYVARTAEMAAPAVTAAIAPVSIPLQAAIAGGGTALGRGLSEGKKASDIAKDVMIEAPISAATGKLGEMAINSMINGAGAKAVDWVSRELLGTDAATAARGSMLPQLARNVQAVEKVAAAEPEIQAAVAGAKSGDKASLTALRDKSEALLAVEREARPDRLAALNAHEPIKVGDVVGRMEKAAEEMPAGDVAAENGLKTWIERIKSKWGTKPSVTDPFADVDMSQEFYPNSGVTLKQALKNYQDHLAEHPGDQLAEQGIKELTEKFGKAAEKSYNPNNTVPLKDLRDFVTDMQQDKVAAVSKDFAPSLREEMKYKIAKPAQDFLNEYIDRAAAKSDDLAQLANEYRAANERMRGLITIKNVADQRLGLGQINQLAGRTPIMSPLTKVIGGTGVGGMVAGLATGHIAPAAAIAATGAVAMGSKALAEKALISLIRAKAAGSVSAAMIETAIKQGVPRAAALAAAGITQGIREHL